ncbi:RHS repeat-associated core domain-containing protein [Puniceicoccaceae bacterium K14]|nr:RHS repeat-associated core domain-containing protein [Puniceicoccaceae bacterium K14]
MNTLSRFHFRLFVVVISWFAFLSSSSGQIMDNPVTVPVKIEAQFTTRNFDPNQSYSDTVSITFYGDDGASTTSVTFNDEDYTMSKTVYMKPGKTYEIDTDGDVDWLTLDAPNADSIQISSGSDLIERTKVYSGGSRDIRITVNSEIMSQPVGVSSSLHPHKILWSVGLGRQMGAGSAGNIWLRDEDFDDLSVTPDDLYYGGDSAEVTEIMDSGTLRQVLAPEAFVDIVSAGSASYEIRFYEPSDMGSWNSGNEVYNVSGTPFITYAISNDGTNADSLKITRTQDSVSHTTVVSRNSGETEWILYDWASGTTSSNVIRKITTSISGNNYTLTEVGKNGGSSFVTSTKVRKTFANYSWGDELLTKIVGYGGSNAQTTSYEYYTSSSNGAGTYKRLKKVTRPDGGYTRYTYYNDTDNKGKYNKVYSPFEDTQEGTRVEYTYGDDGSSERTKVTDKKTYVNGTQVGREVMTYSGGSITTVTTKSYSASGSYIENEYKYYREDHSSFYKRGRPYSVTRADGTRSSYAYFYSNLGGIYPTYLLAYEIRGLKSNPGGASSLTYYLGDDIEDLYLVNSHSTAQYQSVNDLGQVTFEGELINHSGSSLQSAIGTSHTFDEAGRNTLSTRKSYSNGSSTISQTIYEATYDGPFLEWSKDAEGKETEFITDSLGRITHFKSKAKNAGSAVGSIDQLDTFFVYDGASRILEKTDKGTYVDNGNTLTEEIVSEWTYDTAGRMTTHTPDTGSDINVNNNDITINYTYYASQDKVTVANPDGGDIEEVFYMDGTLNYRKGTATTPLYRKSRVTSNQLETWTALESFSIGSYKDGWNITRFDWLGRTVWTREPTDTSYSRYNLFSYNSKGQLDKRRVTRYSSSSDIIAPYRYTYDDFGRVKLEGYDTDNDGLQETSGSSSDRINKYAYLYYKDGSGYWWHKTLQYAFPEAGQAGVLAGQVHRKIGLGSNQFGYEIQYDYNLNLVKTTVTVDRSVAKLTETIQQKSISDSSFMTANNNYYVNGFLVKSTSQSGVERKVEYDHLRRTKYQIGRNEVKNRLDYHSGSNRVSGLNERYDAVNESYLPAKAFTYDTSGRLKSETKHNVKTLTQYTDPAYVAEVLNYEYNGRNQLTKQSGGGTFPIEYDYNDYGWMVEQIQYRNDAGSNVSTVGWEYDGITGLLDKKRHFGTATTSEDTTYTYNELDAIKRRTWSRGVYTDYTYFLYNDGPATGQLKKENHSDTTTDVSYTYDRMARYNTISDYTGTRTFEYNQDGGLKLSKEDLPSYYSSDLNYLYEASASNKMPGRYRGVSYSSGNWTRTYDYSSGRISSIEAGYSGGSKSFTYGYIANSDHVASVSHGSWKQERNYESWRENRVYSNVKWSSTNRARFEANVITWQHQVESYYVRSDGTNSLADKYGSSSDYIQHTRIDDRGQVFDWWQSNTSGTTYPGGAGSSSGGYMGSSTYDWSFDSAGNRTSKDDASGAKSYSVNRLNEIEPTGGTTSDFDYDADGNLTGDGDWTYQYDANNRIRTMYDGSNYYMTFRYDYMGRRVRKLVEDYDDNQLASIKFLYNGMELLAELNSSGSVTKSFHWGPDISDVQGGAGGAEGLIYQRDWGNSKGYFPAYDLSGNLVGLLNDFGTGDWAAWYAYDAFGNIVDTGPGGTYQEDNPIRYSTQYTDKESGLVYYGFRFYDPTKGRFLTRDPIGEAGGANLYRFVGNDSVNRVDRWGLATSDNDGDNKVASSEAGTPSEPDASTGDASTGDASTGDESSDYVQHGLGLIQDDGSVIFTFGPVLGGEREIAKVNLDGIPSNPIVQNFGSGSPTESYSEDQQSNQQDSSQYQKVLDIIGDRVSPTLEGSASFGKVPVQVVGKLSVDLNEETIKGDIGLSPALGIALVTGVDIVVLPSHGNPNGYAFGFKAGIPSTGVWGVNVDFSNDKILFDLLPGIDQVSIFIGEGWAGKIEFPKFGDVSKKIVEGEIPIDSVIPGE